MQFLNKFETEVQPSHELICLPNAASFNNTFFNQPLTDYSQGWRDPANLEEEIEFVAPLVEVPRRFSWRKFGEKNDFLTESDDARAIGGDFKRVKVDSELTDSRTINRGLTIFVDLDEVGDLPGWEERYTGYLLRRSVRNDLITAIGLLSANASNTGKTWDTQADPDADLLDLIDAAGDDTGINPNRIFMGGSAWAKRVKSFRAQDNAGARASAMSKPDEVAAWLGIEQLHVSRTRYQSTASAKSKIEGALVVAFEAASGQIVDDPANIKRFASRCDDGNLRRVYRREVNEKVVAITVERYVRTQIVSTLGLKKYTIA
jgi:hypothetical protein